MSANEFDHDHILSSRESLSRFFVYESYDEETGLFFNRGSCGFVLIANSTPGLELTAENEISEFVRNEENLPNGSSLQVLMIGSSDIEFLLNRWASEQRGEVYQELAAQRCNYLRAKAKDDGVVKDVHLLISVTIPSLSVLTIDMQRRRDVLKSTFESIGLYSHDVDDYTLIRLLRKIWGNNHNYKSANGLKSVVSEDYELTSLNDTRELSKQILAGDFSLHQDDDLIYLNNDRHIISLCAEDRPSGWSLQLMDSFIGTELRKSEYIKTDYLIHVGFQLLENQTLAKSNAFAKREAINRNIKAGFNKFFPDLDEEFEDLNAAVSALQAKDRMINLHMNVILIGEKEKVLHASKEYASMMRRNGFNFAPTRYDHLLVMLAAMPMSLVEQEVRSNIISKRVIAGYGSALAKINRCFKTVSGETKALLPIVGEWKGDLSAPGMLLVGRRGQLMYWSQFGAELVPHLATNNNVNAENYNVCIAGVSGSGKSVFMQELMKSVLSVGGKVFVLDYGRSFEELCKTLGGNYIEFDPAKPISINPFSSVPTGHDKLSIEARNDFLASFPITLATMAAPKSGTSDLQFKILKRALFEVWEKHQNDTQIDAIADWLNGQEDLSAKDLSKMLFDYTSKGSYGGFFAGSAEVSLNADIVVIETDYLRNYPDLMAVVMQTMITHINHTMAKSDRLKPSLIVIDEMAKTLQSQLALQFVAETVRIVRRYKASVVVATQLLTDFHNMGSHASSIFAGSAFKIILKQNSDVLNSCKSIPLLKNYVDTEARYRRMLSVESRKNEFSECTIWSEGVYGVIARLRLDPFTLLLMSTNPTDKVQIANYKKQGHSLTESIRRVLKDRGQLMGIDAEDTGDREHA